MSRLSDALLTGAYQKDQNAPMLNVQYGGQGGWAPNLSEWVSNQAYVSRPVTCILLEPPKLFTVLPDSAKWIAALKALFELHPKTIEGLSSGLKVDFEEHDVGGAGEKQQEVVNVTRERSQPKHSYVDKYGRPIQTLLDYWIRYGMMDPDTKFALAGTLGNSNVKDLLADWMTASALYYEPDPLHQKVQKAWLCTNMMPMGNGDITGKRDLTGSQEMSNLDIEFTAITQTGLGVNAFAQTILDSIKTTHADPSMKASFITGISADVSAVAGGYKSWTETVGSTSVTNMAG